MANWVDVSNDDTDGQEYQPQQGSSPFGGFGPVDKIAYVDDDSPIELRAGNPTASVEKPAPREKPQSRKPAGREKRWLPADEPPAPKTPSGNIGIAVRAIVTVLLLGAFAYGAYLLVTTYQSSVHKTPQTPPTPTASAPASPAAGSASPAAPAPSQG